MKFIRTNIDISRMPSSHLKRYIDEILFSWGVYCHEFSSRRVGIAMIGSDDLYMFGPGTYINPIITEEESSLEKYINKDDLARECELYGAGEADVWRSATECYYAVLTIEDAQRELDSRKEDEEEGKY